ncbi:hypothetical protein ACQKWADRAFT_127756 [Trichoderma austrokoningii]
MDTMSSQLSTTNTVHSSRANNRNFLINYVYTALSLGVANINICLTYPLSNGNGSRHYPNNTSSSALSLAMLLALVISNITTVSDQH